VKGGMAITLPRVASGVGFVILIGVALAYWWLDRHFQPGEQHALDGIVRDPVAEHLVIRNVGMWDGISDAVREHRTVEPGKSADIVLLDRDPTEDIEALTSVRLVIKEGRVVFQAD
jgi:hypothetical protein